MTRSYTNRDSSVNQELFNYAILTMRIFCSVIIVACFIWFTKQNLDEYRRYPTSTMYSHTKRSQDRFPDLILCNSVKHDKNILSQAKAWSHLPALDNDVFMNLAQNFGNTGYQPLNKSYYVFGLGDALEDNKINYLAERRFDLPFLVEATMSNLTSFDTKLDDFIVECWFESVNCSSWFQTFTSLSHGVCFNLSQRYQPDFEPIGKLQRGYQITFYRNPLKASGIIEPIGGVSVTVTDKNYMMVPEVESFLVPWGQGLEVKVHRLEYYRVTNCTTKSNYSEDFCAFRCLDWFFVEQCNCSFSPYWNNVSRCLPEQQSNCLPRIAQHWNQYLECKEKCISPCTWKGFSGEKSHFSFPSDSFTPYLLMDILQNKKFSPTAKSLKKYLEWWEEFSKNSNLTSVMRTFLMLQNARNNFAYLHIFEGNNKEVIMEEFIISPWTIFSNIGGNVGIWLGLSAFNILDMVLTRLKRRVFQKFFQNQHKLNREPSNGSFRNLSDTVTSRICREPTNDLDRNWHRNGYPNNNTIRFDDALKLSNFECSNENMQNGSVEPLNKWSRQNSRYKSPKPA